MKQEAIISAPIKRCAIYARKSTNIGMEQAYTSIDAQIDSCLRYIENHAAEGWVHVATYKDVAVSGGTMDRPEINELLEEVRNKAIDAIVVYKLDRVSRSIRDFSNLMAELDERGVALVITTQNFDSSTAMGRFMLNFLSSFAEFERDMIRSRIRDKAVSLAQKGMWNAGKPPIGYTLGEKRTLEVQADEAEIVQKVFRLIKDGEHPLDIADMLNKGDVPPRFRGKPRTWNAEDVRRIVQRRIYVGVMRVGDEEYPAKHEALISEELWQAANKKLKRQTQKDPGRKRQSHKMVYPLKGILRCPICGRVLSGTYSTSHGYINRYYVCPGHKGRRRDCPYIGLPAMTIEKVIAGDLVKLVDDPTAMQALRRNLPQLTRRDIREALENVELLVDRLSEEALQVIFSALYKTIIFDPNSETLSIERYTSA